MKAKHETPKKHYLDDLTFSFKPSGDKVCDVHVSVLKMQPASVINLPIPVLIILVDVLISSNGFFVQISFWSRELLVALIVMYLYFIWVWGGGVGNILYYQEFRFPAIW